MPATGEADDKTQELLQPYATLPPVIEVTLDDLDFGGPFVGAIPKDARRSGQAAGDGLRQPAGGHCRALPHQQGDFDRAERPLTAKVEKGARIKVPNVRPEATAYAESLRPNWKATLAISPFPPTSRRRQKVVVDKSDGVLRVYAGGGKLVAQFPATMGSSHDPLPIGTWKILGRSYLPKYHYNPQRFWDANKQDDKQTLPAGPNGPVGRRLDRHRQAALRHPRHAQPRDDRPGGKPRLRAADQLGCGPPRLDGEVRHAGRLPAIRQGWG